jgi:nitrite reductase/ring-hydroxylating ferredoxin subunit
MRALCRVEDLPDGETRGFGPAPGAFTGLFALRRGERVQVWVNACPHLGVALDWAPDRFLTHDGARIVCSTHGAEFRLDDGLCVRGPCKGERLEAVPVVVEDGMVLVPESAGV